MQFERRRTKWAPGGLQKKIVWTTACVGGVIVLFNIQFSLLGLWMVGNNPAPTMEGVIGQIKSLVWSQLLLATLATIPLSIWVGLTFFKICGPIYRFKKYFLDLETGRWDQPCNLRRGDGLQDMKQSINGAMELLTGKIRRQDAVLREVREELQRLSSLDPDGIATEQLISKMDVEITETSEKLGLGEESSRGESEKVEPEKVEVSSSSGETS